MFKKSLKYLAIVFVNLIILTILLAIWSDKFELEFNDFVRPIEFLKLIGISLLGLIILRIAVPIFQQLKINSIEKKIKVSIILILVVSSYFYVDYGIKVYSNRIADSDFREGILRKIKPREMEFPYGNQVVKLTGKEYAEITKVKWFPKLPESAENISYSYFYDGFLPDYSFSISYDLPIEIKVDTMNIEDGNFSKNRNFEIIGNKKRVTYSEGQW